MITFTLGFILGIIFTVVVAITGNKNNNNKSQLSRSEDLLEERNRIGAEQLAVLKKIAQQLKDNSPA